MWREFRGVRLLSVNEVEDPDGKAGTVWLEERQSVCERLLQKEEVRRQRAISTEKPRELSGGDPVWMRNYCGEERGSQ